MAGFSHDEECPRCHKIWPDFTNTTHCPHCGLQNPYFITPGKDCCGNCHQRLQEGDAYCRKCGTKAGEGAYDPYWNFEPCVYGPPPVEREHTCPNCGYSWTNCVMIDTDRYCPKCGGKVTVFDRNSRFFRGTI